jgi:serine/threonine protein kinase
MPLASHIQLPERYRVTRHIASGGMASVWEVEDLLLGRVVAVKVLGAHFAADRGARARFAREARTAARVGDHPNIATIYDIGEHGDDAFIVMELFSGGTVADRLRTAGDGGGRVPRETALRWLREAAGGLDFAHAAGIVHRDVKPANLLLDGQERLAVGDFGIARLVDDTSMTQTGQLLGTAAYLSPEQALGGSATAASDRYALAVVAYELLTGARPFAGGPATAQVRQHAEEPPARASVAAPELPRAIDAVFGRGLAKRPQDRPRTAAELVGEMERALRDREPVEATRPLKPVTPRPRPATAPAPAPVAAAGPAPGRGRLRQPPAAAPASAPPRQASPPPPAPPSTPSREAPPPAPGAPPERHRIAPLVPIGIAAAVAGAILAIVLIGSGNHERRASTSTPQATQTAPAQAKKSTKAPAGATQPAQTEPQSPSAAGAASTAASNEDPATLNDRGFALSQAGNYAAAVPLLRASVDGYRSADRTKELGYAYALFNLAVALNHSGDHAAAIDLLRERLGFPNQLPAVKQELKDAKSQLGGPKTKTYGEATGAGG